MAGLWVEEIDALAPEQKNGVTMDGTPYSCSLVRGSACIFRGCGEPWRL